MFLFLYVYPWLYCFMLEMLAIIYLARIKVQMVPPYTYSLGYSFKRVVYVILSDPWSKATNLWFHNFFIFYKFSAKKISDFVIIFFRKTFIDLVLSTQTMTWQPFEIILETHWEFDEQPEKNGTEGKKSPNENYFI